MFLYYSYPLILYEKLNNNKPDDFFFWFRSEVQSKQRGFLTRHPDWYREFLALPDGNL